MDEQKKTSLTFEAVTRQEIALETIGKKIDTIIELLQQQNQKEGSAENAES